MKSLFNKSFCIFKENMLFIQPVLLCLFFISISLPYIFSVSTYIFAKIVFALCMFLLSVAVIGGTFAISKKAVDSYHVDDELDVKQNNSLQNFKFFFEGVGNTFFKVLFSSVFLFIFSFAVLKILDIICTRYIGVPAIASRMDEFVKIENIEQARAFVSSFSTNDLQIIRKWILSFFPVMLVLNFIGFLYYAVVVSEKDNFIICFFKTIIFFFKNIFKSIWIIIVMFALYLLINIVSSLFGANSILLAIAIVFMVMYLNYYIILVLCFYNEKSEDNSNSGTECIGKNESCD